MYEEFKNKYNKELVIFIENAIKYVQIIRANNIVAYDVDIESQKVYEEEMTADEELCLSVLLSFLKSSEALNAFSIYNISCEEILEDLEIDPNKEVSFNSLQEERIFQVLFKGIIKRLGDTLPLEYFLFLAKEENSNNNLIPVLLDKYFECSAYDFFNYQSFVTKNAPVLQFKLKQENK